MLLPLVLLAQTATTAPAPAATPAPVKVKFSGGFGRQATTTGARVVIGPDDIKAAPTPAPEPFVPGLTKPAQVAATVPAAATLAASSAVDEESAWRARYGAARAKLGSALSALRAAEQNVGNVVTYNGRPSQAHWIMAQARDNALLPYRIAVEEAQREVDSVRTACRVTYGCAPGWVRD